MERLTRDDLRQWLDARGIDAVPLAQRAEGVIGELVALGFAHLGVVRCSSRLPGMLRDDEPSCPEDDRAWDLRESASVMLVSPEGSAFASTERDGEEEWVAFYTLLGDGRLVRTVRRACAAHRDHLTSLCRIHARVRVPGLQTLLVRAGAVSPEGAFVDRPGAGYRQQCLDERVAVADAWSAHRVMVGRETGASWPEDHNDPRLALAVQRRSWHVVGAQMGWTGRLADGWRRASSMAVLLTLGAATWSAGASAAAAVALGLLLSALGQAAWAWCVGLSATPALALGALVIATAWTAGLSWGLTLWLAMVATVAAGARLVLWLALQSALAPWLVARRRSPVPVPAPELVWAYRD